MSLVAVYGTLRKGESRHSALSSAAFIGTFTLAGWDMYDLGTYPAVWPGDRSITVEVYDIDKDTKRQLDRIEGVPRLYEEVEVSVEGIDRPVSIYRAGPLIQEALSTYSVIPSGDWLEAS